MLFSHLKYHAEVLHMLLLSLQQAGRSIAYVHRLMSSCDAVIFLEAKSLEALMTSRAIELICAIIPSWIPSGYFTFVAPRLAKTSQLWAVRCIALLMAVWWWAIYNPTLLLPSPRISTRSQKAVCFPCDLRANHCF